MTIVSNVSMCEYSSKSRVYTDENILELETCVEENTVGE